MNYNPSVEQELLIRCCREQLHPGSGNVSGFLREHAPNWRHFVGLTNTHKLFPLVHDVLKHRIDEVPADVRNEIAAAAARNLKRMMNLAGELGVVHQIFKASGIEFIALKGPVMVKQLFGDYRFRQTRDLDILVEEQNIDKAIASLLEAGYLLQDGYFLKNPEKRRLFMIRENHVRFRHPSKMVFIELHWSVSKYFTTIPTGSLFERSVKLDIQGKIFRTLDPEDYFVVLATHGIYHRYELLFWLYDIAHIMRHSGISQQNLLAHAGKFNCTTAAKVSMALAAMLFIPVKCNENEYFRLTIREKFLFSQCLAAIFRQSEQQETSRLKRFLKTVRQRISAQLFLLLMTNDLSSKKRVLLNTLIKPYVWPDETKLPRNNLVYLLMTQVRWIKLVLSGQMTKGGKVRKKKDNTM